MGTNTPNIGLYKPTPGVETDWGEEINSNADTLDEKVPYLLDSGTFTASGGSTPAASATIQGVSTDETAVFDVILSVASSNFAGDYAYNYEVSREWDNTAGQVDVTITVNWDTDPGAGNDVTFRYSIQERSL